MNNLKNSCKKQKEKNQRLAVELRKNLLRRKKTDKASESDNNE